MRAATELVPPSWSGLSRPSTSSFVEAGVQDMDAGHKAEHDGKGAEKRLTAVRLLSLIQEKRSPAPQEKRPARTPA